MPIKQSTKAVLEEFVRQDFTLDNSDALENNQSWTITCHDCFCPFQLRVDSIKQSCYNGKLLVCPTCKHRTKVANFEYANDVTMDRGTLTCNGCELSYRYTGDFFRTFHCYCGLAGRQQDAALYRELDRHHMPGTMAKELVYVGTHRCDMALYRHDGTVVYVEVDDQGHFSGKRAQRDRELVASFLENRKDNEFLLRIDARLVAEDAEALADRIWDWDPAAPVTLAYSGERFRYHYLELELEDFEILP